MSATVLPEPSSIVEIRWVDSIQHSGWRPRNDFAEDESLIHWTSGYLLKESDDRYFIAQSFGLDFPNVDAVMEIPKCSVLSFRVVTTKVKK